MLLIGDSIIQKLDSWSYNKRGKNYNCDVICYRGCTISRLKSKLERRRLDISQYHKIIVHMGTNDIMTKDLNDIKTNFIELLVEIQSQNSRATLIFSLPIPRPRDLAQSWPIQESLNKWIIKHQPNGNYKGWRSYMTFFSKRRSILQQPKLKNHQYFKRDGLHLTDLGAEVMNQQIRMAITLIR